MFRVNEGGESGKGQIIKGLNAGSCFTQQRWEASRDI